MKLLPYIAILMFLAGCGSATPDVPTTSVSGNAVAGAVTSGTIFLKDSLNREISTQTATDGSYSLNTTGMKKPYWGKHK